MNFEEIGSNVKSLFKNKKFVVLCIIVGAVALVLWIIRQNRKVTTVETEDANDYYDGSKAIGYGGYGYPTVGDESGATDYDWLYDRFDALDERFTDMMTAMEEGNLAQDEKWQGLFDSLNDRIDGLGDEDSTPSYSGGGSIHIKQEEQIDVQAIIDAMEYNSNAWWDVSDQAGRDYLHNENQYLASLIGATYDSQSGQWMYNGAPLYSVDKGNAQNFYTSTGTKTAASGNVSYVANVDYQSAINEGLRTGSLTAAQINALNEERNNKISSSGSSKSSANASFDANTDYQALINNAKAIGASQDVIDNLTAQRNAKIAAQSSSKSTTSTKTSSSSSSSSGYTVSTNRNPVYKTGKSSVLPNKTKTTGKGTSGKF